jgi:redox-sensitive bicupin YhaK (pirin superfamily)
MDMTRRDALRLLVAAGASATAACSEPEQRARATDSTPEVDAPNPITAVRALVGSPWPTSDPFLFCVHHDDHYPVGNERMGPATSLEGRRIGHDFDAKDGWSMYHGEIVPGFPRHPHRGFETVTVVRRGLLDHSDSMGAAARYGEGDVQWLTAGQGILHAEMFPLLRQERDNPVELFQIWLNLPSSSKMVQPYFSMLWKDAIPVHRVRDAEGRETVITTTAGRYGPAKSPPSPPPNSWASRPESDLAIWTIQMAPGGRWTLPAAKAGTHRSLYFFRGSALRIAGRDIPARHQVEHAGHLEARLDAGPDGVELLLLQGRPLGEPIAKHGPFVMNTTDEIRRAYADYRRTQFGGWPWQSDDPVHGREEGRFARHANGRIERPA